MNTNALELDPRAERFGRLVASRLDVATDDLPYDITERLRAARVRAVANRSVLKVAPAAAVAVSGGEAALHLEGHKHHRWGRLAAFLPLLVLLVGLMAIQWIQEDRRASELAEIDAEILTDDLPPEAFTDPGFVQFLRNKQAH